MHYTKYTLTFIPFEYFMDNDHNKISFGKEASKSIIVGNMLGWLTVPLLETKHAFTNMS